MGKLSDSIVRVETGGPQPTFGTGFVAGRVNEGAVVITCRHVVRPKEATPPVFVRKIEVLQVLVGPPEVDLAVLIVPGLDDVPPCVLREPATTETEFSSQGYQPHRKGHRITLCSGTLEPPEDVETDAGLRLCILPLRLPGGEVIKPGYSGAPLLDDRACAVVGVFTAMVGQGPEAEGLSISHLRNVCPRLAADLLAPKPKAWRGRPFQDALASDLHWIDCRDFHSALHGLHQQECPPPAALFLLQNAHDDTLGHLWVRRARSVLEQETRSGHLLPIQIAISEGENRTVLSPLRLLADELGVRTSATGAEGLATELVAQALGMLKDGRTLLFSFQNWDRLTPAEPAIAEFLRLFWSPLVQGIQDRIRWQRRVRCIGLLVCNGSPEGAALPPDATTRLGDRAPRHHTLSLSDWTAGDLEVWLEHWSPVPDQERPLLVQTIMQQAKAIHPVTAHRLLLGEAARGAHE